MTRPIRFPEYIHQSLAAGTLAALDAVLRPNELRQDAGREAFDNLIANRNAPLQSSAHGRIAVPIPSPEETGKQENNQ